MNTVSKFPCITLLLLLILPLSLSAGESRISVSLASGIGFSRYGSLNSGIRNAGSGLDEQFGYKVTGTGLRELLFDVPILLNARFSPFNGKVGRRVSLSLTAGYIPTISWNTFNLVDTTLKYNFTSEVIPIELGASYTFLKIGSRGSGLTLAAGAGIGFYLGRFSIGYEDSAGVTPVDTATYPRQYGGTGFGGVLTLNCDWQLSGAFALTATLAWRTGSIDSLKARVIRGDGSTAEETLYINDSGFLSGLEQPAGSSPAGIDLSGFSAVLGFRILL